jgi:hypothetical protein
MYTWKDPNHPSLLKHLHSSFNRTGTYHAREALKHFEWICEKGVYSEDITFVFLVAMQVWWMKACAYMLQCPETI